MQFDLILKCYQLTVNNSQNCEVALTECLHFKFILSAVYSFKWCSLRKLPTCGDAITALFSRQMTSEKRAQKFHTDDASLSRFG